MSEVENNNNHPTYIEPMLMTMNLLMLSIPVGMLAPYHQSLIRSAGVVGFGALEEAVSKSRTMLCVEVNPDSSNVGPFGDVAYSNHVPLSTHQRTPTDFPDIQKLHEALNRCMGMLSLKAHFPLPQTVPQGFLLGFTQLTNAEVSLPSALVIGSGFLSNCISLRTLKVYLPAATHLEGAFIQTCPQLTTLEIDLPEVISIGDNFLANNYKLENVVISTPKLVEIGDHALSSCPAVTKLQLHLPHLTTMGRYFLKKTTALSTLDLHMPSIRNIGWECMGVTGVTSLSLYMPHVEKIGERFMFDCPQLKSIVVNAPKVRMIVKGFLQGTTSLTKLDLTIGSPRTLQGNNRFRIGDFFTLQQLVCLEELNLTLLEEREKVNVSEFKTNAKLSTWRLFAPEAVSLDPTFFTNNKSLKVFELRAPKLQYFPQNFLHQCVKLESVIIDAITADAISSGFMWKCPLLSSVVLHLPSITTIATHYLRECPLLTNIDMTKMPLLSSIGGGFMQDCKSLVALNLDPFISVLLSPAPADNDTAPGPSSSSSVSSYHPAASSSSSAATTVKQKKGGTTTRSIKIEGCRSLRTITCSDVGLRDRIEVTVGKKSVREGIEFLSDDVVVV